MMNDDRRKQLRAIRGELKDIYEQLDILHDEEQDAYYNLPVPIQGSERGYKMQSAIEALGIVRDQLLEVVDEIVEIWE